MVKDFFTEKYVAAVLGIDVNAARKKMANDDFSPTEMNTLEEAGGILFEDLSEDAS